MKNLLTILKAVMAFSGAKNHSHTEHNLTTLTNKSEINENESINYNIPQEQEHEFDPVNKNKVTKIGWIQGNRIRPFPENVNEVPEVLPSHIRNLDSAFKFNTNVKIQGIEKWDTSKVTIFKEVFFRAENFNQPITWDTSSGVNFQSMFQGAPSFNSSLGDKFDTSKGRDFFGMFQGAKIFNQPLGDKFDTRNARSLHAMFSIAHAFNQRLPEKFVIKEGVNVVNMFYHAHKFNQDLSYLIVSDEDIGSMTNNTVSWEQKNRPILKSDTKSIGVQTRVKEIWDKELKDKIVVAEGEKVQKSEILEKIKELLKTQASDLDIQDVELFEDEKDRLINRDPEDKLKQTIKIKINNRIGALLDVGKTAEAFTIYIDNEGNEQRTAEKDLYNIQAKEIKQIGYYHDGKNIRAVRMPKTVTKVPTQLPKQITSISNMFEGWGSNNLTNIEDIKNWNTTNIVEMNEVFKGSWISKQDLNWKTQNVTSMKSMFENSWFDGDISSWDVRKVTDMSKMFHRAVRFNNNSISSWQIDSLKDISNMFNGATIFNQNISNWDIKNERFINVENIDINTPAWEDKNKPFPRNLQLKDISDIIKEEDRNVGNFNVSDNEELKTKVLEVLKQKYPKLDFDSLVLEIKSNTQATLKSVDGENRRYKNEITINYLAKYNISSLGLTTSSIIVDSNDKNEIIEEFIKRNEGKLDGLTKADFEAVGEPKDNSITLKVVESNNKYHGSIVVNYSVRTAIDTQATNTNVGSFDEYNFDQIIEAFIAKTLV
ncbi:BspA family leucine-rich repeat surface protein [Mycoplasma cottewii]|uniref:BspA family leucine-rich repeat surface protein n=1 Tax=Mycoplasma cottewii TaxID=51364 RepID=A0ABY5U104_9MOLU|nr:BspA family leucine-rich repeat surface protein [Mycoplasma cottewii]UWD34974.1 BspA family leucine-rich repeat surface protein [Mycoplasma cottewii]